MRKKAPFAEYVLPRLQEDPRVSPIDNLIYDGLGEAVLRIHNERFQGTEIADIAHYQQDQPISYSNVPRALSYNQILHRLTNGRIQVASPADMVRYWNDIPERDATHAHTSAVSVFPEAGPNEYLRQRALALLERLTLKVPLLVAGLGVKKADNIHGFTFTRTEFTTLTEAPYLVRDGKVQYDDASEGLIAASTGVPIWTPDDQSGLRRACRYRGVLDFLDFRGDRLLSSVADGRVQVVQRDLRHQVA